LFYAFAITNFHFVAFINSTIFTCPVVADLVDSSTNCATVKSKNLFTSVDTNVQSHIISYSVDSFTGSKITNSESTVSLSDSNTFFVIDTPIIVSQIQAFFANSQSFVKASPISISNELEAILLSDPFSYEFDFPLLKLLILFVIKLLKLFYKCSINVL